MPVWLKIIAANAVLCLACYARAAHKAYKSTEAELEEAKRTIKFLENNLRIANSEIKNLKYGSDKSKPSANNNQIPDFLLADDPMQALLHEVGKVRT